MSHNRYHRSPKTTQERKASQDKNSKLIRAKRVSNNLPNAWDDLPTANRGKTWKCKRRNQFRDTPRGPLHIIKLYGNVNQSHAWLKWGTQYRQIDDMIRRDLERSKSFIVKEKTTYTRKNRKIVSWVDEIRYFGEPLSPKILKRIEEYNDKQ